MSRNLCLVLDLSAASEETDLRPSRLQVMLKAVEEFIREYFDSNPISQLCVVSTHDSIADKISDPSGLCNGPWHACKPLQGTQILT